MEITAKQVKELRNLTGAGMLDCKKALVKTKGDAKAAAKLLKEKGLAAVEKRTDKATSEGIIVIKGDEKKIAMAEMVCETDFVAKNADFIQVAENITDKVYDENINEVTEELKNMALDFATRVRENMSLNRVACLKADANEYIDSYVHHDKKTAASVIFTTDNTSIFSNEEVKKFMHDCCLHLVAFTPAYLKKEDAPKEYVEEQRDIFKKQVADMDKPEKVKNGIVQGKLNKHLSEICFLEQPFIDNEKVSVADEMNAVAKKAGGKLKIVKTFLWNLGR
ncbi:MAG: translation elongation factor Ts [Treponemataceae bacterium]